MNHVTIFKAIADETRLRILNLFIQGSKPLCVCEMVDALRLPQYTISKALGILRNAGLTISGKQGTWVYNQLNPESRFLRSLFQLLQDQLKDQYTEDIERLKKRLALREGDLCVIGVALNDKLDREYERRVKK